MNFYKHHLGDYSAATSHLSWDEDCAYRRLIDQYYKREAPLPPELKDCCRLVRAMTSTQKRAVEVVLSEFFETRDDGRHQKRCDQEIAAANLQADTNRRIAEEREAKRRARLEHESSNEPSTNRSPATIGEREPSQTPDSRLQTPDSREIHSEPNGSGAEAPSDRDLVYANGVSLLTAAGVKESSARSFLAAQCKSHGEAAVLKALNRCAKERPVQPVAWLQAILGANGAAPKARKADALMAGNIAAAQRYLEGHSHD